MNEVLIQYIAPSTILGALGFLYKVITAQHRDADRKVTEELGKLNTKVDSLGVTVKELSINNNVDVQIDNIIEKNLYFFKSKRMQKHLIWNGESLKKYAHYILNMGYKHSDPDTPQQERLNDHKIDQLAFQMINENNSLKGNSKIDSFLLNDYLKRTKSALMKEYIEETKRIYADTKNNHNDRFIRLSLNMFDRIIDAMAEQYIDLLQQGFNFDDKE